MRQNHSDEAKKMYSMWVELGNYSFLAQVSDERWSMAMIINRLIEHAREQGPEFVLALVRKPR